MIDFITRHLIPIAFIVVTVLGILIRIPLRDCISNDANKYLLPWYEEILNNGLSSQVGNYNFPYQLAIFFLTKLPMKPLYAYKLLSCGFDLLLAVICALLVFDITKKRSHTLLVYCAVLLSPVVILNSAAWAQCDSIFVFFAVCGLYLLLKDKTFFAMLCFGLSLAFKLQAVFFFPGLMILYFMRKDFSIGHFLAIPLAMVVLSLPMIFWGRSLLELVSVYAGQSDTYHYMTVDYPSLYCIFSANDYDVYSKVAILLTVTALGALFFWIVYHRIEMTKENTIMLLFLSAFTCVLFLPAMHERYGYPYEILAWVLVFLIPKTAPLCVGLQLLTLRTYSAYLFGTQINLTMLAFGNLILYCLYVYLLLKQMQENVNDTTISTIVDKRSAKFETEQDSKKGHSKQAIYHKRNRNSFKR